MKIAIANTYGKIRVGAREYVVNCAGECGRQAVSYLDTQKRFVEIIRQAGWKKIDNTWWCPWCAMPIPKIKEPVHAS
jgi:hypothetical protein